MTDEQTSTVDEAPSLPITFRDREIWVHLPSPEQLLVWRTTLRKLQGADVKSFTGEEALNALDRARRIIDSVIVNQADKDWLDDEMLDGNLGLREAQDIIRLAIEKFADVAEAEGNRETRRAAAKKTPAKKAARKKAAPRA